MSKTPTIGGRFLEVPQKAASWSRPGSPAPDRRHPIALGSTTKATPHRTLKTLCQAVWKASWCCFVDKPVFEITPPVNGTEESRYVLTDKDPSLFQRAFKKPITNARLGVKPDRSKSARYEFVFPRSYASVRVYAKPWQTPDDLPDNIFRVGEPGQPAEYRFEPFIVLRRVRNGRSPPKETAVPIFAAQCTSSVECRALHLLGNVRESVETCEKLVYAGPGDSALPGTSSRRNIELAMQRCSGDETGLELAKMVDKRLREFLEFVGKREEEKEFLGYWRAEMIELGDRVEALTHA